MKRNTIKAQAIAIIVLAAILAITTVFLHDCCRYLKASNAISNVENEANYNKKYINGDWYPDWSEEMVGKYNAAVESKKELQEESDVAEWCYLSGYTVTGWIVRALAILAASIAWIFSAYLTLWIIKQDLKYFCKKLKRCKARKKSYKLAKTQAR